MPSAESRDAETAVGPVARWRAVRHVRVQLRALASGPRITRIRGHAEPIVQTALAAGIAWLIAVVAFGPGRAFFAPVAAIIVLGVAPGRRIVRSGHVIVGIGLGVLIGETTVAVAGTGFPQVVVAALLALTLAVWLDGAPLFVSQTAVSAVLVTTLEPLVPGSAPTRLMGALIGGLVGLGVLALSSRDPARAAAAAMAETLDDTAGAIGAIARSLRRGDPRRAREAQGRAASILAGLAGLPDVVGRAEEAATLAGRRRDVAQLRRHASALAGLHLLGGDVVGLARAAARALELQADVPRDVVHATTLLAEGTRGLRRWARHGDGLNETRATLRGAARTASEATEGATSMPVGALAGAIRSVATDLLHASGVEPGRAISMVRGQDSAPGGDPT